MTKQLRFVPALLAASVLGLTSCSKEELTETTNSNGTFTQANGQRVAGQYIVVLKKDLNPTEASEASERIASILERKGIRNTLQSRVFNRAIQGAVLKLSESQVEDLRTDASVAYVEADQVVTIAQPNKGKKGGNNNTVPTTPTTTTTTPTQTSTQQTPWGIANVGYASGTALSKTAWIIDSGIQLNHPDLNVDAGRSRSFLSTTTSPADENGHGTSVAGVIAAKDNLFGVIGVAAGAQVVSLRALDASGSGTSSSVISALNWVYQYGQPGDVVNLSLGGGISQALDDAVIAVANRGIRIAVAAGNSAVDVVNVSPARVNHPNVYTVSAMQQGNSWAYFSNFGSPTVDFCAPGVNIYTTSLNDGYGYINGTSFAAPHVAGILMLNGGNILTSGFVSADPDGMADPIAHR